MRPSLLKSSEPLSEIVFRLAGVIVLLWRGRELLTLFLLACATGSGGTAGTEDLRFLSLTVGERVPFTR